MYADRARNNIQTSTSVPEVASMDKFFAALSAAFRDHPRLSAFKK
jgi:hypothetical protein